MPGLDLPDPCPGTWILGLQGRPSMHSRPPRSLPGANPPPDLREGPQWHTRRPTSAKLQSGKIPARPPRKSGGRENSCRANPGPTFWPGDLFGSIFGSRKTYFCEEMILWWGYRGIPSAQMNSMVPGTHLGVLVCPKTSLFNYFVGISSFPGKLQVAPASLAYFPLWGPAAVAEGLRIRRTPQVVQGVSDSRVQASAGS